MRQDRVADFVSSMVVDHEKWHDGIGYDVGLIDGMNPDEKDAVEAQIRAKGISDWRDLEALDRLGGPSAIDAILSVRQSGEGALALRAHQYGPASTANDREDAILLALGSEEGRLRGIGEAAKYPTPKVVARLFECARDCAGTEAYQSALALYFIHGKIDSMDSWDHRQFFLRFVDPGPDKDEAVLQLEKKIKSAKLVHPAT
jgi:hypothetical protein